MSQWMMGSYRTGTSGSGETAAMRPLASLMSDDRVTGARFPMFSISRWIVKGGSIAMEQSGSISSYRFLQMGE